MQETGLNWLKSSSTRVRSRLWVWRRWRCRWFRETRVGISRWGGALFILKLLVMLGFGHLDTLHNLRCCTSELSPPFNPKTACALPSPQRELTASSQNFPVDPYPASPRSLAGKSCTTLNSACTTGTIINWAMRSMGSMVKGTSLRFHALTISWPW